jgi:MSHA biogenesis protein MshQ
MRRASSRATERGLFTGNITFDVQVQDSAEGDGAITGNTATFNGGGPGIAFDSGAEFRYGRARLLNAMGSEKVDLPVPLRIDHHTGTAFVTNTADNCTRFATANFTLSNYQGGISAANVPVTNISATGSVVAGAGTLILAKPTSPPTSPGRVEVCWDLGADVPAACTAGTAADQRWLQDLRSGTDYDDDPRAGAAFGLYGSQPNNFIFFRENF